MTLRPTNDFVLLEEIPAVPYHEYRRLSKIIVPEQYAHGPEDRAVLGIVKAKGNRCTNLSIRRGQQVVIGKWMGARFPRKKHMLILVKEEDILAIVTK